MALSTRLKDLDATSSNIRVIERARRRWRRSAPTTSSTWRSAWCSACSPASRSRSCSITSTTRSARPTSSRASPACPSWPRSRATATQPGRSRACVAGGSRSRSSTLDLVAHRDAGRRPPRPTATCARRSCCRTRAGRRARSWSRARCPRKARRRRRSTWRSCSRSSDGRVLLVDTDLRRPRLHRVFGTGRAGGMSTSLSGLERSAAARGLDGDRAARPAAERSDPAEPVRAAELTDVRRARGGFPRRGLRSRRVRLAARALGRRPGDPRECGRHLRARRARRLGHRASPCASPWRSCVRSVASRSASC